MKIKRVVYSHYFAGRWYFVDTLDEKIYFLSIRLSDIKYLIMNGLHILLPPTRINHIKWNN